MVSRFALAAAMSILASGATSAQALQDSQSWTTRIGETGDSALLRWHFSSEEAAPAIGLLPSTPILETDITTLTGQVDFFPFGDEFYLSSLTVEGGAYFQDRGRDRLQILDQDTGETMTLLDDLDNMDRQAVGETQARSFRPVAHLVIRRRF